MNRIEAHIAVVVRDHVSHEDQGIVCRCGDSFCGTPPYHEGAVDEWADHVAQQIAQVLQPELDELASLREYRDSAGVYIAKSKLLEWATQGMYIPTQVSYQ